MNISVIGKGKLGGGLARRWRKAGHTVNEIGRAGGNVSSSEVVLVAMTERGVMSLLSQKSKRLIRQDRHRCDQCLRRTQ